MQPILDDNQVYYPLEYKASSLLQFLLNVILQSPPSLVDSAYLGCL